MTIDDSSDDTGAYDLAEDEALPMPAVNAPASAALPAIPMFGACAVCKVPIAAEYYMLGTARVCPNCRAGAGANQAGGFVRFLLATLLGILGGLAGAAVWIGAWFATQKQYGLIAVLVGFLVGIGVLKGSGNRGGRGYQFLAIALTYLAIAVSYSPEIYGELNKKALEQQTDHRAGDQNIESGIRTVLTIIITIPIAIAAPILSGFDSPITIIIAAIALWEAWKINRLKAQFLGPFNAATLPPPMPIRR